MTVLEASGHLYEWFSDNESFCIESDFMKVIPITESPNRDRATFLCALKDLEDSKLIQESEWEGKKYWVLSKSFLAFPQSVSIPPDVCLAISQIINKFCDKLGNDVDKCDPGCINDGDIKNLIYICSLLTSEEELDNEQEE